MQTDGFLLRLLPWLRNRCPNWNNFQTGLVLREKEMAAALDRGSVGKWSFFKSLHKRQGLNHYQKAPMDTLSGVVGGYLVPNHYNLILMRGLSENNNLLRRVLTVPIEVGGEYTFPKPKEDVAGVAGQTPFFGGLTFQWVGSEGTSIPQDEPSFSRMSMRPHSLLGQLVISDQLLEDMGVEGEKALIYLIGKAAAWYLEYAILRATGTANQQPIGMLNASCKMNVTRAGAGAIAQADIAEMAGKMIPSGWNSAIWMCHPRAYDSIAQTTEYEPNTNSFGIEAGCVGFLYSRPLYITEKLPNLGTAGDLIFVDPAAYVLMQKQEVAIDISQHPKFITRESVIRVWLRADGKPILDSPVTLADGSTTASSVIVLE